MSWRVILRPNAQADAARWYESQRPNLGSEFIDEIGRAILLLAEHPERHPVYYGIEADRVIVFRILHAKRNPRAQL